MRAGDDLSFTRLQELLGLTPGNLITHLRKLENAGYVTTVKSGSGVNARTSVSLSQQGRQALETYTSILQQLLDSARSNGDQHQRDQSARSGHGDPGLISPGSPAALLRDSNETVL